MEEVELEDFLKKQAHPGPSQQTWRARWQLVAFLVELVAFGGKLTSQRTRF